jgi:hypothetical protein
MSTKLDTWVRSSNCCRMGMRIVMLKNVALQVYRQYAVTKTVSASYFLLP